MRLSICSSNSKTVGQHWERILAYFDRRLISENGKVVPISSLNTDAQPGSAFWGPAGILAIFPLCIGGKYRAYRVRNSDYDANWLRSSFAPQPVEPFQTYPELRAEQRIVMATNFTTSNLLAMVFMEALNSSIIVSY